MRDFFERQERARRQTHWLVGYFIVAVALMVAAIYLVFAAIFLDNQLWDPLLFAGVSTGVLLVVLIGSLTRMAALRQGGGMVAARLGGVPLSPNTSDPDGRRLWNVVEEMALASGTPVPEVYVLPEERGINAFAAGHTTQDVAIGVTGGCMKLLNRDELQGVIAHEFSHILNGDMRLNMRLMGMVHGILCLAIIGRILLRSSTRSYRLGARKKGGNPLPVIGLALLVIGSIGVFFGRLIKSAVSRQREFLADAAGVQFTRNPEGLASALKKIGGLQGGSRLTTPNAEEASHLFFGNALANSWLQLMSTHPQLEERIRLLDPTFNGQFPRVVWPTDHPPKLTAQKSRLGVPPPIPAAFQSGIPAMLAGNVRSTVGAPTPCHLEYAKLLRESLDPEIVGAVHEPSSAAAVVFALLLSRSATEHGNQVEQLRREQDPAVAEDVVRLAPRVATLAPEARLPVALLTVPALTRLSPAQYAGFKQSLEYLVACDRQVDLFEFMLQKIVQRRLEPRYTPMKRGVVQYYSLKPLLPDCAVLLSALARSGHADPTAAANAFAAGASRLPGAAGQITFLTLDSCGLDRIDAALNRLAQSVPHIKSQVLEACSWSVAADKVIQVNEAELLRAVGDALDCPVPPFIVGV